VRRSHALLATAVILAGCHSSPPEGSPTPDAAPSRYLFLWAGDEDKKESDFLAVVDIDPRSPTYAEVVTTLPVGAVATMPHHTEYEMPAGGVLWANGFAVGRTFRLDLRDPAHPRLAGAFDDAGGFSHPHSYARLPNGNVLATFQHHVAGDTIGTGGLVELDTAGRVRRAVSAAVPDIDSTVRPYSLAIAPALDRVVSTSTDMHLDVRSRAVQIWRLSDLTLLHTLLLPPGPLGDENWLTAEPRVLADGRTVLVNTFSCGLYRLRGIEGETPAAEWIYSSPWEKGRFCAVPAVAGRYWLQPSGVQHAVVSLDVSDPDHPREAGRLVLGPNEVPHWIAVEPSLKRVVITGYRELAPWVLLADLDTTTGRLQLDTTFRAPGSDRAGVYLGRDDWPHGRTGPAVPHGAVFARP
jgi:hypothetical protein